jgi:hypothetical protein
MNGARHKTVENARTYERGANTLKKLLERQVIDVAALVPPFNACYVADLQACSAVVLNEPPFDHLWQVVDHYMRNILKPNTRASLRQMHVKSYDLQRPGSAQETLVSLFAKHGITDAAKTEICAAFENYSSRPAVREIEEAEEDLETEEVVASGSVIVVQEEVAEAPVVAKKVKVPRGGQFDLLDRKEIARKKTALEQLELLEELLSDVTIPKFDEEWTSGGRSWVRVARVVWSCVEVCYEGDKAKFIEKYENAKGTLNLAKWECKCEKSSSSNSV